MQLNIETPLQDIRITFNLVEVSAFLSMLYILKNVYILHGCVFSAFVKRAPWFWYNNMSRLQQLLVWFLIKLKKRVSICYSWLTLLLRERLRKARIRKMLNQNTKIIWYNNVNGTISLRLRVQGTQVQVCGLKLLKLQIH